MLPLVDMHCHLFAAMDDGRMAEEIVAGKKKIASTADHASGTRKGAVIRKTR